MVTFFVARNDHEAGSALLVGPDASWPSLELGHFDPEEAVLEWEELSGGASFGGLVDSGEPRSVAEDDDRVIFAVSVRLQAVLSGSSEGKLRGLAGLWVQRAEDGGAFDAQLAEEILLELAAMVRDAGKSGSSLYCRWIV